jgi:SAM-dependent methyltransferase
VGHAPSASPSRLLARLRRVVAERGVGHAVGAGLADLARRVTSSHRYYALLKGRRSFVFEGRRYRYFYHRYNTTWRTERAVEVPIIWHLVQEHQGRRILEVGNVLSHYFPVTHDIVDKYERAPGVVNQDAVAVTAAAPYDLIVSISTLEHVGWDEQPREPEKLLRAVEHLRGLLAPGGRLVATLPLAYNPFLDAALAAGRLPVTRRYCLRRVSADNRWTVAGWDAVARAEFDRPFRGINALVVATFGPPGAG